jgi:hypothetical protein
MRVVKYLGVQQEEKTARSEIRKLKEFMEILKGEDNYQSAFIFN